MSGVGYFFGNRVDTLPAGNSLTSSVTAAAKSPVESFFHTRSACRHWRAPITDRHCLLSTVTLT